PRAARASTDRGNRNEIHQRFCFSPRAPVARHWRDGRRRNRRGFAGGNDAGRGANHSYLHHF
ncbi:MAG: hypothetical protein MPL62_13500, partial [Alphaproteobacteria bacterium]|nr:hypothetical protein [Alphaproteobacteria bacterium]